MRFMSVIGALAIASALAAGIYFFGGFYSVSAANGGNAALEWTLRDVREHSIDRHYNAPSPPSWFKDPGAVQAGAREFAEEGCVMCHGAPGRTPDEFAKGMDPNPPDLGKASKDDPPAKVFWIVKNGIRMTGMPAFGGHASDDEIWRAVAFAQHMGNVTPEQFEQWSAGSKLGEKKASEANSPVQAPAAR